MPICTKLPWEWGLKMMDAPDPRSKVVRIERGQFSAACRAIMAYRPCNRRGEQGTCHVPGGAQSAALIRKDRKIARLDKSI